MIAQSINQLIINVEVAYLHYFYVSTWFRSVALTEQGITTTLLVRQEPTLLRLWVRHLSGNVISFNWSLVEH